MNVNNASLDQQCRMHTEITAFTGIDVFLPFLPRRFRLWRIAKMVARTRLPGVKQVFEPGTMSFSTPQDGVWEIIDTAGRVKPFAPQPKPPDTALASVLL